MIQTGQISETITFVGVDPHSVFEMLMDAEKFKSWSKVSLARSYSFLFFRLEAKR